MPQNEPDPHASAAGVGQEAGQEAGHGENRYTPSGSADVDAALTRLAELEELSPADHVGVFEDVHERLNQVLSDLDGS